MRLQIRGFLAGAVALSLAACATIPAAPRAPSLDAIEGNLSRDIAALSDDSFGGRFPGSEGESRTRSWIVERLTQLGLEPAGGDGDWTQDFTLARRTPLADAGASKAVFSRGGRSVRVTDGLLGVDQGRDRADIADLPMVGIDPSIETIAPRSLVKRALVLPASALAARAAQFAAAKPEAVVVTTGDQAEYDRFSGFLKNGRWLLESDDHMPAIVLLAPENSGKLMDLIGANARRHADGLGVIGYDTILEASITQKVDRIETANIVGRLPGRVEGSGAVLMLAHWDHLGEACRAPDAADRLCNGAVDNASGIAVMVEAVRLALSEGPLDRDLIVLATSSEELGLLGAEAFVADPPVPLPTIVAAFNLDTMAVAPRGSAVSVIGWGRTPLDQGIEAVVEAQGRQLQLEDWHQSFLRRQDGWALLSRDVPTVLVSSAAADRAMFEGFMGGNYHTPQDEFSSELELGGAAEDTRLHAALLRYFGSVTTYSGGGG